MEDKDANQEALEQVERITESEPVSGEDLLGSEKLKLIGRQKESEATPLNFNREIDAIESHQIRKQTASFPVPPSMEENPGRSSSAK